MLSFPSLVFYGVQPYPALSYWGLDQTRFSWLGFSKLKHFVLTADIDELQQE